MSVLTWRGWLLPAQAAEEVLDDDAIVHRVEAEGSALIRSGKAVKLKMLRTQLQRARTCALDLPSEDTPPLTPRDLYARRATGVLVVGVLARQGRRRGTRWRAARDLR